MTLNRRRFCRHLLLARKVENGQRTKNRSCFPPLLLLKTKFVSKSTAAAIKIKQFSADRHNIAPFHSQALEAIGARTLSGPKRNQSVERIFKTIDIEIQLFDEIQWFFFCSLHFPCHPLEHCSVLSSHKRMHSIALAFAVMNQREVHFYSYFCRYFFSSYCPSFCLSMSRNSTATTANIAYPPHCYIIIRLRFLMNSEQHLTNYANLWNRIEFLLLLLLLLLLFFFCFFPGRINCS